MTTFMTTFSIEQTKNVGITAFKECQNNIHNLYRSEVSIQYESIHKKNADSELHPKS